MFKRCALIVLLLLACPSISFAQQREPIGSMVEIEGQVTRADQSAYEPNDVIYLHDTILTGPGARALISLEDDTEITVGENATLFMSEYIYDPDNISGNKGRFDLLKGAFLFVSGLISKNSDPDVEITTAMGSIGLRGTTVWGGPVEDGEYGILVQDGVVDVKNDGGRVQLAKGEGSFIRARGVAPRKQGSWTPGQIESAVRKIALKNPEAAQKRLRAFREHNIKRRALRREMIKNRLQQHPHLQQQLEQAPPRKILHNQKMPPEELKRPPGMAPQNGHEKRFTDEKRTQFHKMRQQKWENRQRHMGNGKGEKKLNP